MKRRAHLRKVNGRTIPVRGSGYPGPDNKPSDKEITKRLESIGTDLNWSDLIDSVWGEQSIMYNISGLNPSYLPYSYIESIP